MKTLISIVGPTAVGKTALSIALAQQWNTEIISCDSRQFYRGMDIGTAKVSIEEQNLVKHHFLDFLSPDENYNSGQFEEDCEQLLRNLFAQKDIVILVGGSTLYAHALWHGIDEMPEILPEIRSELNQTFVEKGITVLLEELAHVDTETYQNIDKNNHVRVIRALEVYRSTGTPISVFRKKTAKQPPYRHLKIGLNTDRKLLYERIDKRVEEMIKEGLLAEVNALLEAGFSPNLSAMRAIGYAEIIDFFQEKYTLPEAISLIQQHSRNYAKRQLTFFRREKEIIWLEGDNNLKDKILKINNLIINH